MIRRLRSLVAVFLIGGVLVAAPAGADRPESQEASSEHQRIVEFWTGERISKAEPRDFVFSPGRGFEPAAPGNGKGGGGGGGGGGGKPGGGGDDGGGGGGTTSDGASWNAGGDVLTTTGKVFFRMGSSYYQCSASVIEDADDGRSLVLTAAHCVYDEASGNFATDWLFIPEYDSAPASFSTSRPFCDDTVHGCWTGAVLSVHDGYATAGGFNATAVQYDFAVVAVGPGGKGGVQLDSLGSQPYRFGEVTSGSVAAFGYPAEKKYKGNDLIYCSGPIGTDPNTSGATYKLDPCKLNGGSSGGPWFEGFADGSGTLVSVNSYGYTGINAMHGPKLNDDTADVYDAALTTQLPQTGQTGVVVAPPQP